VTWRIVWRPAARADLLSLYDWIAGEADRGIALDYVAAIEARTAKLADFPHQGAPRPDLGPGVRTIAHRRRTVIAYVTRGDTVEIVALAHGGRDLAGRFSADEE
jgi:toxin ParE1/3/4